MTGMNSYGLSMTVMAMLLALALLGSGVMAWPAWVAGPELTPAQDALTKLADGTVKVAVGALLGFAGGIGLTRRQGRG